MSFKEPLRDLVGRTVTEIYLGADDIVFVTAEGLVGGRVVGGCCSTSYLHDLIGFDKLIAGPVVKVEEIDLGVIEGLENAYEEVQSYGIKFVVDHPQWGEVTAALSFRNRSNGYYGGWMDHAEYGAVPSSLRRVTGDVLDVEVFEQGGDS